MDEQTPFTDFTFSPIEQELDRRTRLFWSRVFHYAIFPFPGLAGVCIMLAFLTQWTVFLGAALFVFAAWAVCLFLSADNRARAIAWLRLAFDLLAGWVARLLHRQPSVGARQAEEYRIEGATAVRAASLGTVEGDIQAADQKAAYLTQIARLQDLNASATLTPAQRRDNERIIVQLRRNVTAIDAVYAAPVATPESIGDQPMKFFGPVAMVSPFGWLKWAPWALAGALGLSTGWFAVAERDARADLREAERQRAIEHAQRVAAEDVLAQYRAALEDAQDANRQSAEALEAERARVRAARERERRRQREMEQINNGGPPPDWFSVMQQPGAGARPRDSSEPPSP